MNNTKLEPHRILEANAPRIQKWFEERGGIALWRSLSLSNPDASWTTPLTGPTGAPAEKPSWQAETTPYRVITDQRDVIVDVPKEVKRFHVAVRPGRQGMTLKLTDASTERVKREVAKAGESAWYAFDYERQDAVIFVPGSSVPLSEWQASDLKEAVK